MNQIRVGIIGNGYWGPNLIRNFVEMSESEVVVVADLHDERLAHVQARYPSVKTTQDYRDFFTLSLDAVVIATPPATHFNIAQECLQQNLHTFVEKPMTLDAQNAQVLVEMADDRDLILMVGHTFEYNLAVRTLKWLVATGELGQVYYVDAVWANLGLFQPDLNVLWDLAPHGISILRYILGQEPIKVCAHGGAYIFHGKHDVVYLRLLFPDEVFVHARLSWLDPCKVRRITVVGSQKMVVYDDVEPLEKIKIYDKGVEKPHYTDTFEEFQCSYRYGDVVIPNIRFIEPLRIECQHFLECIANHTRPQSDGWEGMKVVRILEVAERSLQQGGVEEAIDFA
jgi:predicted dehydrogenase